MRKISLFKSYISLRSVWNVCTLLLKSNYGAYIGEGPEVKAFEQEFAKDQDAKNAAVDSLVQILLSYKDSVKIKYKA